MDSAATEKIGFLNLAPQDIRASTVAVSGSGGFVGGALTKVLASTGQQLKRLVRSKPTHGDEIHWRPEDRAIDAESLEEVDAVVHLAAEPIVGRWTKAKKQRIRESRVDGTQLLCDTLARIQRKPRVLVAASAIGYYGHRGAEWLDEDSSSGTGFLADTCVQWEQATERAAEAGIRVVRLRIGLVLSPEGGGLRRMLPFFRLGAGGVLGHGGQWWSWITLNDLISVIQFALINEPLRGSVNAVSPNPVSNRQFTKALGHVLRRPTICPVPRFAARLGFGELADEAFFASQRVKPARLQGAGFQFDHPQLEGALAALLTGR